MITIQIIGTTPPCAKCKRAEKEAQKTAEQFPGQVQVIKIDALSPEAERYGLVVTPTVVVNEQLVGSGKVRPADQLVAKIKQIIGG
ncbi:MAG: thioredoxin family protein [Chloroflexi bacterium]|nr:thioredoxin family protein [Chloroflexota bacterium]